MTSEPLLLAARELARGLVASLPVDYEVVASATAATHLAVLLRSRKGPKCVRLGVLKTDEGENSESFELVDIPTTLGISASFTGSNESWTLAWSPDARFLVVSGRVSYTGDESQSALWIFTHREWISSAKVSCSSSVLMRFNLSKLLAAKQWNPATNITHVFFPVHNGSKVFVLSEDGVWLNLSIKVAKLSLALMNAEDIKDTTDFYTVKSVKKLTEWHAGITAACYDPRNSMLVVSGGVQDPSVDLTSNQASSLSVWKIKGEKDNKDVEELLDYTMVVKDCPRHSDQVKTIEGESDTVSLIPKENGSLFGSFKNTLLAPLKMMVGINTTETRCSQGWIRHLALAPNGNFVSMIDDLGRVAIRQIDVCADVLKWQTIDDVSCKTLSLPIKHLVWLTSNLLALFLTDGSVVYASFYANSDEAAASQHISSDNDNERVGLPGRLVLIPVRYHRFTMPAETGKTQTLALVTNEALLRTEHPCTFIAYEFLNIGKLWAVNQIQNFSSKAFIQMLMDANKFEDALALVALHECCENIINADNVHRQIWTKYREQAGRRIDGVEGVLMHHELQNIVLLSTISQENLHYKQRSEFLEALDHLRAISDKRWVIQECLTLIADDSSASMKKILDLAWDAWVTLNGVNDGGAQLLQEKAKLQRFFYRLETLRLFLCEEAGVQPTSLAAAQLFEGTSYALFRALPILSTAKQFALEGRVSALTVLFYRQGWNLLPHWLKILNMISPIVPPSSYTLLLPGIPSQLEDNEEIFLLSRQDDFSTARTADIDLVTPLNFLPENRHQDLTDEELSAFQIVYNMSSEERDSAYCDWFSRRIIELDTHFGQLFFAYELSKLALQCSSGWSSQRAQNSLVKLLRDVERLYKCVYSFHLSASRFLPLNEWSILSLQDQATIVLDMDALYDVKDVPVIIERFDTVFVSQRMDCTFGLDELISGLAQSMALKSSLAGFTFAAQLIRRSNSSIQYENRWIQSDARLIETALSVIYSIDVSDLIGDIPSSVDTDNHMQPHLAFLEQLWIIIQSLPARNELDPPKIAQLQVRVDEAEDLVLAVDVLSKYGIVSTPSSIKSQVANSNSNGVDVNSTIVPLDLLEQMCNFALSGKGLDGSEKENQWLEVFQDALQLQEHAFGDQFSQHMILDVILKHLLVSRSVKSNDVQNLVKYWIALDIEAVDHVITKLMTAIRAALDSIVGYSEDASANAAHETALCCMGIVKQLLSLPVWDTGDRAAADTKQHYEKMLCLETDKAYACELLDLLTYGTVKLSLSQLEAETLKEQNKVRLDAVCQIFVSNPSNYKPSARAREWLAQHHVETLVSDTDEKPLAAIMHLAKLLRVDSYKIVIWMKGAYAALYCMDYNVAHDLTMQVIDGMSHEDKDVGFSGNKVTLLNLVSLVLDLVSATSFKSWSKKRKLCLALFSAATINSSDLFSHQVTDLVLSWLEKIEAMQALMIELGLQESDLEQRRLAEGKGKQSVAVVLLNEVEVVVDLLYQEKNDSHFVIRLLQRGFHLSQVKLNDATEDEKETMSKFVTSFLQQIIQLSVEEIAKLTSLPLISKDGDWQQYMELGASHLMLWSDLCRNDATFKAFCVDIFINPALTISSQSEISDISEGLIRWLHHFFLIQAVQARYATLENNKQSLFARRKRLNVLLSSYGSALRTVNCTDESFDGGLSTVKSEDLELPDIQLLPPSQRSEAHVILADQCHEWLVTQKKSQDLDQMSLFFSTDLDSKRFSNDANYRTETILILATQKESFLLSRQLASKHGIDEYDCVLAYIKHCLLYATGSSRMDRRDQLDQAFMIEETDILEEALQKPNSFGDFLLTRKTVGEPSLYETIDGTDHVGALLILRMVLECSKRLRLNGEVAKEESSQELSILLVSKPIVERITLLFLCLKKLKDIGDSLDDVDAVDLKLIGAASTTTELLTPLGSTRTDPQIIIANRNVAVEAVRPLMTNKTIKLVTKILRKLHRVTPSAMVMIYMNDLLNGIWKEHQSSVDSSGSLSANVAVYAYKSCVPCRLVLLNEHLMLFHCLFLKRSVGAPLPKVVEHLDLNEEFYGQQFIGLQRFGALLVPQNRVEIVTDTLTLFQTKYNSWQQSGLQSNVSSTSSTSSSSSISWDPTQLKRKEEELDYLERELMENICYMILHDIEQNGLIIGTEVSLLSLQTIVSNVKTCFAMDVGQLTASNNDVHSTACLDLCQHVASVDLASLTMELTLHFDEPKASIDEVTSAIVQRYQYAVDNLILRCMGGDNEDSFTWMEELIWSWVMGSCAPSSGHLSELRSFLEAISSSNASARDLYQRVVKMLSESPSIRLKEVGIRRLKDFQCQGGENAIENTSIGIAVRQAIFSQWEKITTNFDEDFKWAEAAILSHVLVDCANIDDATWHFGLYVKAIWSTLLAKFQLNSRREAQRLITMSSRNIFSQFAAVFEQLLAFIEGWSNDGNPNSLPFSEMATTVLSHLLVRHDYLCGRRDAAPCSVSTEHQIGIQARIQAQFQIGTVSERKKVVNEETAMWSALFVRGVWGTGLLNWYTTVAYTALSGEERVTEEVILAHWEANNLEVALPLLLMCPFDGLREKYVDRTLPVVRQLPQGSHSWSTAMELALLRFDMAMLLQHNLYSSIVAFLKQNSSTAPALWTSSGAYVVSALVNQCEFAAAGRLTCALRHTHPLLWDLENARLVLGSYLRELATSPVPNSHESSQYLEFAHLQHEVYNQTYRRFANALLQEEHA
ncbi:hypothetical protein CCR75_003978 [Bremia lactucae]|uniref:Uncharacterized protein n=1 Tax=Bremia lactucae TaxID=4779 RepID=A0A976FNU9_BRELC|nr:hypothetical protein CCR75_003978 [Bremia lactucae]